VADDGDEYVESACYKAKRRCHALEDSSATKCSFSDSKNYDSQEVRHSTEALNEDESLLAAT